MSQVSIQSLKDLATALAQAGENRQAHPIWQEAERVARSISHSSPPPKTKPRSISPSLIEEINTVVTSPVANIINFTGSVVTITTALIVIRTQWSKNHSTVGANPQEHLSQPLKTDIVAIHLQMTHGPNHYFEEWLTNPERLKHYIDVFLDPNDSVKPLQAIFVKRNGEMAFVDVSKGTSNNPRLNELLSYLHSDTEEN